MRTLVFVAASLWDAVATGAVMVYDRLWPKSQIEFELDYERRRREEWTDGT